MLLLLCLFFCEWFSAKLLSEENSGMKVEYSHLLDGVFTETFFSYSSTEFDDGIIVFFFVPAQEATREEMKYRAYGVSRK